MVKEVECKGKRCSGHNSPVPGKSWHCKDCKQIVVIDYLYTKDKPELDYTHHNIGFNETCKFMPKKCELCGESYKEFYGSTYVDTRYGEPIHFPVCGSCKKQIGAKLLEPRKGYRFVPMWAWGAAAGVCLFDWFVVIPATGQTLNFGGIISPLAIFAWQFRKYTEW